MSWISEKSRGGGWLISAMITLIASQIIRISFKSAFGRSCLNEKPANFLLIL
jgi:hypothetical protein